MITRRKAALLQALPESITQSKTRTPGKSKTETAGGVDTPAGRELAKKMQVISLSSESEEDDDSQEEDSESYCSDEKEVSAMSQSSDLSAMNLSSDDECTTEKDDECEVVQSSSAVSIYSLIAEKVLQIIKDGGDLKKLTLDNCRSYLRHNGMRISGNKPVLIDRIKQHIELKQGVLEKYRAASFTVNCTGDVCKGDVIKFKQKVYNSFNTAKRGAEAVGERTVVGRVVKESYGEKKQQHTFTVEVLWSAGYKPLPPMRQLLVKGRNLYKLRTYRQKWENEGLRKTSLDEKHERGAAARAKRRATPRASGPRKIAVGSRKQLPNPYVAMGITGNSQPDYLGGRGSAGRGCALLRSWFPRYPLVHVRPNMLPHKPMVTQKFGYNASRVEANPHISPPAGVAHDTRVQPPRPETRNSSEADPADRRQYPNKSPQRCESNASKEDANRLNISSAGVLQAPRRQSRTFSGADPAPDQRQHEYARKEDGTDIHTPSSIDTRVQPRRVENKVLSGADPAVNKMQIGTKSPCRSYTNRWRDDRNNRNIPATGVPHDTRDSDRREIEPIVWRRDGAHYHHNSPNVGVPHDTRASPLRPPSRVGSVSGEDLALDRRQNENRSPRRCESNSWRKSANYYKDPIVGPHDIRAQPTRTESGHLPGADAASVLRQNENQSPWRYDTNAWIRGGNQGSNTNGGAFHHTQNQQARTQHNFSVDNISGVPRNTGASPLRLQGRLGPLLPDPPLDKRQSENRSPWRYDSNSWRRDVEQHNHISDGVHVPPLVHPPTQHFNCANVGCLNYGSKLCSYRVCVRCCKTQGRPCSNPKH